MKKKLVTILGLTMIVACMAACGANNVEQAGNAAVAESTEVADNNEAAEDTEATTEMKSYEFETFDGITITINEGTITSQEACENPLEWDGLPADAEQIAPGRDCILFEDADNYYVEDATNGLVTIAFKEQGDIIEESDYAIFDNEVYTFEFDTNYFVVNETEEDVTVSFYNEEKQTAGSNTIVFKEIENADAKEVAKELAGQYGVDEANITESHIGESTAISYSFSVYPEEGAEGAAQTRSMACAMANGDNVITFEILTHVEPDEGMDMFINDKISEVIDTFKIK